ncbi:MAG: extracellular solute-binding protein [Oscillospiraceae bacterium]
MKRFGTWLLALLLLASSLTGCAKTPAPPAAPVTLTMLCNWSPAEAKAFTDGVRKKLPHITLDCEICPIGALPYDDEVDRRVLHNTEADVFMTTDTDLWSSGKLLNFTDEAFVPRYNLSIMKTLSDDGSVYFIPGLGDVLCYLYHAEWLEEVGLPVPKTEAALDGLFAAIKDTGKQPFLVPYSQMPTQYVKVLIAGYLSTPKGQQWLSDYNAGKTTMAQDAQWQRLWNRVEELTKQGYLRTADMAFTESRRIIAMQEGSAFMTTFSSSQYGRLSEKCKSQFQLMPLLGEKPENQMVYTAPTCYFAVSNRLASAENADKRAAALQLLDFISTDEGQELLRGDNPLAISYLSNTVLPVHDQCAGLAEIIEQGAYAQMPAFARGVEPVIEELFGKMVAGKATAEEAIRACDAQNASYVASTAEPALPVLGTATEAFPWTYMQSRTEELALIDFCMDSVRKATGADYALELGTAFRSELFPGDITSADVESVIRQEKKLYLVEVTGQQIWDLIEQGVTLPPGCAWFIAPSGFRYSYRRLDDGTGQLLEITLEDGTPLDLQKTYSVAVSENQIMEIPDLINFSKAERQELPITLREAVTAGIREQGELSPRTDGRIQIIEQ